jgi:hypothetical protein
MTECALATGSSANRAIDRYDIGGLSPFRIFRLPVGLYENLGAPLKVRLLSACFRAGFEPGA